MDNLVLLRHGNSLWNQENLFTGWVDVRLSELGEKEAKTAGQLLREANRYPDVLFTSLLTRSIQTAHIALMEIDRVWLPTFRSWRLNERHYGSLQGKNKAQVLEEFGEEQFNSWRRGYDTPPPPLHSQADDPRYEEPPPLSESLKDVQNRLLPYWQGVILPHLVAGKVVLVVAHGNSLRALVKHLECISDTDVCQLNIPTGIPLVYSIDPSGCATRPGRYLP
ncbi:MAG: 2,3-bisphosphoglycerate-dependent phosphoglycerate mutase [Tropheryma whipplei]|nr:2,3-bisphosphoglycerate-dependent phosphoglycerate mutase [Tropheryma whipplei]